MADRTSYRLLRNTCLSHALPNTVKIVQESTLLSKCAAKHTNESNRPVADTFNLRFQAVFPGGSNNIRTSPTATSLGRVMRRGGGSNHEQLLSLGSGKLAGIAQLRQPLKQAAHCCSVQHTEGSQCPQRVAHLQANSPSEVSRCRLWPSSHWSRQDCRDSCCWPCSPAKTLNDAACVVPSRASRPLAEPQKALTMAITLTTRQQAVIRQNTLLWVCSVRSQHEGSRGTPPPPACCPASRLPPPHRSARPARRSGAAGPRPQAAAGTGSGH